MIELSYDIGHRNATGWWESGPNSAGGVSISLSIKNLSEKSIKYYHLYFIPYNAVGDVESCRVRGYSEVSLRGIGPLDYNKISYGNVFENAWYNYSIAFVRLDRAEIEYMDGTIETIEGTKIFRIQKTGGCYVATTVYGSYDCPEVWTLRRYRDFKLVKTWYGRAFVKLYYIISPVLVRRFGKTKWFKNMWRGTLNRMVKNLQIKGYESTPYTDKDWK